MSAARGTSRVTRLARDDRGGRSVRGLFTTWSVFLVGWAHQIDFLGRMSVTQTHASEMRHTAHARDATSVPLPDVEREDTCMISAVRNTCGMQSTEQLARGDFAASLAVTKRSEGGWIEAIACGLQRRVLVEQELQHRCCAQC